MEPDPVIGDSITVDEEATEEKEVSENCDDNGVSEHDVRNDAGEKCDEGASGPEGGKYYEEIEHET